MSNKPLVLVVEDDDAIRRAIVDALSFDGYETVEAATVDDGMNAAVQSPCNLVLLDLVLPGGNGRNGLDILQHARRARPTLPIIILTAMGDEGDRVKGLKLGADDYVVKPFSVKELLARVAAVLRRSPQRPMDVTEIDLPESGALIDLARAEVRHADGSRCDVSEKEVELLRYLATNGGRAISRDELLENVWGMDPRGLSTRTIDMHVARLREKLRDNGDEPRVILTVRGKGYMFGTNGNGQEQETA